MRGCPRRYSPKLRVICDTRRHNGVVFGTRPCIRSQVLLVRSTSSTLPETRCTRSLSDLSIRSFEEQDLGMSLADGGSLDPGTPVKLEIISDAPQQVWELRT